VPELSPKPTVKYFTRTGRSATVVNTLAPSAVTPPKRSSLCLRHKLALFTIQRLNPVSPHHPKEPINPAKYVTQPVLPLRARTLRDPRIDFHTQANTHPITSISLSQIAHASKICTSSHSPSDPRTSAVSHPQLNSLCPLVRLIESTVYCHDISTCRSHVSVLVVPKI
jgi:hypothetical protein